MSDAVAVYETLPRFAQREVDDFIYFVSARVKAAAPKEENKAKSTLHEIQALFADEKGWDSEEEMLEDMAAFRRERLAKCAY